MHTPITIERIPGEPLRFLVPSRGQAGIKHLVDLQEHGWNGFCGCQDYEFHCAPNLTGQPSDKTRCWHIRAVREWLLNQLLREIAIVTGQMTEKQAVDNPMAIRYKDDTLR